MNKIANKQKTYNIIWGPAKPGAVTGGVLCKLPNDAPVPTTLLEVSVDMNNNSVYIEPNSRNIKGWRLAGNNKRYILDLIGFWKELK